MPKRSKLPFMNMSVMTGVYLPVHGLNANTVARTLRGKYKDMKFTVRKPLLPGLAPKILVEYKDGRDITPEMTEKVSKTIGAMLKE